MLPKPRTRTFRSAVLRTFVPRLVAFAAGAGSLVLGHALAAGAALPAEAVMTQHVLAAPASWTLADVAAFPGCVAQAAWPKGTPAAFVVVSGEGGAGHHRIGFDRAWRLNHNAAPADDLWVVGICG
jgi:hypothetical protein